MRLVALVAVLGVVGCARHEVDVRYEETAPSAAEVTPARAEATAPEAAPADGGTSLSGLPLGSDVYHALRYLREERDAGRLTGFRMDEANGNFYAWRASETSPGGEVYLLTIKDHVFTDLEVYREDRLPPRMPRVK